MTEKTAGPVIDYLDMTTELANRMGQMSVEQIIRQEGKAWRRVSPALPRGLRRGPMGNCFGNALWAVLDNPNLIYVEGYAYAKFFPMKHAWVVDGNGTVYDPTWEDGTDYFGVAFDTDWLRRYITRSGYTSVFGTDFMHDGLLEILSKGHLPEEAINRTGSIQPTYYHVSGVSSRASIEGHGLRGGDHGVWLYSDPEKVRGIGKVWTPGHPFEEQDVWLVEPTEVVHGTQARDRTSADEWAPDDPVWVAYEDIPPDRVTRVDNHTLRAVTGLIQPTYRVVYRGLDEGEAMVVASIGGEDVGALRWNYHEDPPVVVDMSVDEAYRRQGIGTGLFEEARRHESRLVHSEVLTDDGRALRDALPKTAAEDTDYSDHVMICLKPSEALRKVYADLDECTEDSEELHVTLYYLGTIEEAGGEWGKERLYRGLYDFALHSGYSGLTGTINGFGCFMNEDTNVLIALWDIPGIAEFRTRMMDYVKTHGVTPRQDNHGFTPHMTLAYDDQKPFLTLPELPNDNPEEHFISVWLVWGEEWTEVEIGVGL